jgi:hypothetical protein
MWHLQMAHQYWKYLLSESIDHSYTHYTYIVNVEIYTYGSDGTYVFLWYMKPFFHFCKFANGSHINGASLQN